MHEQIMKFSSLEFYNDELIAADSVKEHVIFDFLEELSKKANNNLELEEENKKNKKKVIKKAPKKVEEEEDEEKTEFLKSPLFLVDTSGCEMPESVGEEEKKLIIGAAPEELSKLNVAEAQIAIKHVKKLLALGIPSSNIAIISPYSAQVNHLKQNLPSEDFPDLEIGTVDGFQGREKEAIIMSFVRSNEKKEVGFLKESRRTNVALTRAKRHLCVIYDSGTLSNDKFLQRMIEYFEENGAIRTPEDYEIS